MPIFVNFFENSYEILFVCFFSLIFTKSFLNSKICSIRYIAEYMYCDSPFYMLKYM